DRSHQRCAIQTRFSVFKSSRPTDLADKIPGIARSQLLIQRAADDANEIVDHARLDFELLLGGNAAKYLVKLLVGTGAELDLGLDPAQKSSVHQACRIYVGGKDDQHLKRNLNLPAASQSQKINSPVKRDNPAVQQFFRAEPLASEIIDDQGAVIGFHLHRADVESCARVELQVHHLRSEEDTSELQSLTNLVCRLLLE